MKYFLLCFLVILPCVLSAQEIDRVEIRGNILVPEGFEAEGITIFNKSASLGAVATEKGNFSLKMAAGDTLIFAAVQFRKLELIVEKETMDAGVLYVEIFEGVNELPEIIIKDHNLTGDVVADIDRIEVEKIDMAPFYFPNIKDLNFQPDSQTTPENAAENWGASPPTSVDFNKVAGMISSLLFPKKNTKKQPQPKPEPYVFLDRALRSRFEDQFFVNTFGVEAKNINDFISFSEANGLTAELLKEGKELELIQFLMVQSEQFRKEGKEGDG